MALYPALLIAGADEEWVLAAADEWGPTAADVTEAGLRIFFAALEDREAAHQGLALAFPGAAIARLDVDDEDWARRSQSNLGPIVVGRIVVRPADGDRLQTASAQRPGAEGMIDLAIQPSMGFGTGHHATTRLCLDALQRQSLAGATVLDIGTGSGVLALAARALGADRALGLDYDPDALQSARANLPLNPGLDAVAFEACDITRDPLPAADVVTANLTGTLLCRTAPLLAAAVRGPGTLIVSGLLDSERDAVVQAFSTLTLTAEAREDEWVALTFVPAHSGRI
ncbi:MAG: 50S ribosomal protein L11 methyltransferase [Vicinamibacterales bacterium]